MKPLDLLDKQRCEGFPESLVEHHRIVAEVAHNLAVALKSTGLEIDTDKAALMGCIHDAGKSIATNELSEPGSTHEELGVSVAERLGVPSAISKICKTHSSTVTEGLDIEEIVVRLADKLWRGRRDSEFEIQAIHIFAAQLHKADWEVFVAVDSVFESIAESGCERLAAMA